MRTVHRSILLAAAGIAASACSAPPVDGAATELPDTGYPWHFDIVSTTFWVGEEFDPEAPDGSQRISAYDSHWYASYGGCDGRIVREDGQSTCRTEERTAEDDYYPTAMTPKQNPFYLDLPFDDVNNPAAFAMRGDVVPWADEDEHAGRIDDRRHSLMKNRWVVLHREGRVCYGQIEDAGPGVYDDVRYVFGDDDARPANERFNGAGLDVSPALNGCLGFADLDGQSDRVDWAFVDESDVPDGPWTRRVTRTPLQQ